MNFRTQEFDIVLSDRSPSAHAPGKHACSLESLHGSDASRNLNLYQIPVNGEFSEIQSESDIEIYETIGTWDVFSVRGNCALVHERRCQLQLNCCSLGVASCRNPHSSEEASKPDQLRCVAARGAGKGISTHSIPRCLHEGSTGSKTWALRIKSAGKVFTTNASVQRTGLFHALKSFIVLEGAPTGL